MQKAMWLLIFLFLRSPLSTEMYMFSCSELQKQNKFCQDEPTDLFLLSGTTCTPHVISFEITKNSNSAYYSVEDASDLYITNYNCSDDVLGLSNTDDYHVPTTTENQNHAIFNVTENIDCTIKVCVRHPIKGYCWTYLESFTECVIKVSTPISSSSAVVSSAVTVSSTSIIGYSHTSAGGLSWKQTSTNSILAVTALVSDGVIVSKANTITWLTKSRGTLVQTTPSSVTIATDSSTLLEGSISGSSYAAFLIFAIFMVIIFIGTVPLCLLALSKRKRDKKSKSRNVIEHDWKTTFAEDEVNIKLQTLDIVSITESLVTIAQSVEVILPSESQAPTAVFHHMMDDCSNEYSIEEASSSQFKQSNVAVIDQGQQKTEIHQIAVQTNDSGIEEYHTQNNPSDQNGTMSCDSNSSSGYIITSDTNQQTFGCEPRFSSSNTRNLSLNSQLLSHSDSSLHLACSNQSLKPVSEGYTTERKTTGSLEHLSLNPDETAYMSELQCDCYLAEDQSIFNACVSDYIFQKKINNHLLFPVSASSGYSSSHTPNSFRNSYLHGSDTMDYVDDTSSGVDNQNTS